MANIPWVDKDECIACETCVGICPGVFRMDEDGKSVCYDPTGASKDEIQMAIDICPASCIHWKE